MQKFKYEGMQKPIKKSERMDHGLDNAHRSSQQPEFNVEFIYGKRYEQGKIKYLVKWENYSFDDSSFEPIENLGNVQYNIRGFERKMSDLIFKIALMNNAKKRLDPSFSIHSQPKTPSNLQNGLNQPNQTGPIKENPPNQAYSNLKTSETSLKDKITEISKDKMIEVTNERIIDAIKDKSMEKQKTDLLKSDNFKERTDELLKNDQLKERQDDSFKDRLNEPQKTDQLKERPNDTFKTDSYKEKQNDLMKSNQFKERPMQPFKNDQFKEKQNDPLKNNQFREKTNDPLQKTEAFRERVNDPNTFRGGIQDQQAKTIEYTGPNSKTCYRKDIQEQNIPFVAKKVEDVGCVKMTKPIQFRDPILDREKETIVQDNNLKYGSFNNGDLPLKILKHAPYTRIQKALGGTSSSVQLPSSIYFKVEFKERPSGVLPLSAYVAFEEIRDRYPRELLNYYSLHAILLDPINLNPEQVKQTVQGDQIVNSSADSQKIKLSSKLLSY